MIDKEGHVAPKESTVAQHPQMPSGNGLVVRACPFANLPAEGLRLAVSKLASSPTTCRRIQAASFKSFSIATLKVKQLNRLKLSPLHLNATCWEALAIPSGALGLACLYSGSPPSRTARPSA